MTKFLSLSTLPVQICPVAQVLMFLLFVPHSKRYRYGSILFYCNVASHYLNFDENLVLSIDENHFPSNDENYFPSNDVSRCRDLESFHRKARRGA